MKMIQLRKYKFLSEYVLKVFPAPFTGISSSGVRDVFGRSRCRHRRSFVRSLL